jgi:diguanylate cyclase
MRYKEDLDTATSLSAKTIQRLEGDGLPPRPDVYTVYYDYFAEKDADLVVKIDRAVEQHGHLSVTQVEEIFREYTGYNDQEVLRKSIREVQSTLKEIVAILADQHSETDDYGESLQEAMTKIDTAEDIEEIGEILSRVMQDTKQVLEKNSQLKQRLNATSVELNEMRQNIDQLQREVLTDPLTGLPNRKCFEDELEYAAKASLETGNPLALVMGDIDHFKNFNDTFGHQIGDQVLRLVARSLTDGVKGQDIVARYGGEEFVVILPNTKLENGKKVADNLRKRIADKDIINQAKDEKLGRLTISLGVAQYEPGEDLIDLIDRADKALYRAKKDRNTVAGLTFDDYEPDDDLRQHIITDG